MLPTQTLLEVLLSILVSLLDDKTHRSTQRAWREALTKLQGGDDNLGVIVGTYEPDVQCTGPFVGWRSCLEILADMPATTDMKMFGEEGQPGVQEVLPRDFVTSMVDPISRVKGN